MADSLSDLLEDEDFGSPVAGDFIMFHLSDAEIHIKPDGYS